MIKLPQHLYHTKYRPDIDGLRAIAVLAVVAFHAFPSWISGGFIGVDIFFVISGFLISTIIFENLDNGTFSCTEFYARRIKRIFPALILILIACLVFGWFVLLAEEYQQLGKHIAAGAGFLSNLVLWKESGYFDSAAETKPLLHLWSLGIEEQFYIIWPLILWLSWKRRFNLFTITIVVAAISFYLNVKGIKKDTVATFYSPQTRFWELMSGSILAWVTLYKKNAYNSIKVKLDNCLSSNLYRERLPIDEQTLPNLISLLGLLLLAYGFWRIDKSLSFPGKWALIPVLGAVMIIAGGSKAWANRTVLSNKIVVWFGLISFPLYLWHWPLLSFARILEREAPSLKIRIAAVALSVVLAWITYRFVEHPLRSDKQGKVKVISLLVIMSIVGYIGYNTHQKNGFRFRSVTKNKIQFRQDLIKKEAQLRQLGIRAGICQFNKSGKYRDIDSFTSNWRCFSDDEGLVNSRTLVFGDSHAADKAMGLRLNSVDVVQLGGAGCSINPALAKDQRAYCRNLFELVNRFESTYDVIILANRFPEEEINKENLSQIFQFWSIKKKVYLFTPMPDFTSQMNDYLKNGEIKSNPDFTREDIFLNLVDKIGLPSNFKIIKTSDLLCLKRSSGENHPCSFLENNQLLMTDEGHLSVAGSKIFGKNMLEQIELKSFLTQH